jgi:hypothetical protein
MEGGGLINPKDADKKKPRTVSARASSALSRWRDVMTAAMCCAFLKETIKPERETRH